MPVAYLVGALGALQGGFIFGVTAPCSVALLQPLSSYMILSQAQSDRDVSCTHRSCSCTLQLNSGVFSSSVSLARLAHLAGSFPSFLPFSVSSPLFFILQFSASFRHWLLVGCRPLCRFLTSCCTGACSGDHFRAGAMRFMQVRNSERWVCASIAAQRGPAWGVTADLGAAAGLGTP